MLLHNTCIRYDFIMIFSDPLSSWRHHVGELGVLLSTRWVQLRQSCFICSIRPSAATIFFENWSVRQLWWVCQRLLRHLHDRKHLRLHSTWAYNLKCFVQDWLRWFYDSWISALKIVEALAVYSLSGSKDFKLHSASLPLFQYNRIVVIRVLCQSLPCVSFCFSQTKRLQEIGWLNLIQ